MHDSGKYGAFAMTEGELAGFMGGAEQAMLATLRKNGAPFVIPLGFSFDGEHAYVTLGKDRAGVHRMRNDPRVSMTVASFPAYPTRFVIIEGLAEEVADPDHVISRRILFRGDPDKWAERNVDPERFFASWVSVGRVVFRITITNLITFDGTKTPASEKYAVGTRMPTDPEPS